MTDAFAAAAEPTRRRILQLLARGPQYAGDIAGHFDVTRSAISQHLGVLVDAGLVDRRAAGTPTPLPHRALGHRAAPGRDRLLLDPRARRARPRRRPPAGARRTRTLRGATMNDVTPYSATRPPARSDPTRRSRWSPSPSGCAAGPPCAPPSTCGPAAPGPGRVTPAHVAAGTVREVEPGRRLVLGWGWEGDDALPPDALDGHGHHRGGRGRQPADARPTRACRRRSSLTGHAEGWDHYLERLERVAVKGDAGPDEWAWAPETPRPDRGRVRRAGRAPAGAARPHRRGQAEADARARDLSCHQVAVHLMESMPALGAMAGATVEMPAEGSLESKVSQMTDQALRAWQARGLDGTVTDPAAARCRPRSARPCSPSSCCCTAGTWRRAAGSPWRSPTRSWRTSRELAEPI